MERKQRRQPRITPDIRAALIQECVNGARVQDVAPKYGVSVQTAKGWVAGARSVAVMGLDRDRLAGMVTAYVSEAIGALQAQQAWFGSPEFLENPQHTANAAGLATLHGVTADKVIRILPALMDRGPSDA